jgi:sulfate permease, SulP family
MVVDRVVSERRWSGTIIGAATQNIFASVISSTLTIAFCLSYAALIFSGQLLPWLSYGITITFLSAAISGMLVTLRSSLPFTLAGPDSATSAVTATLAAAAVERLQSQGVSNHLLVPVLIVLATSAALAGFLLCGLWLAKAGRIIRFVPYPVIGGFLGASGWLIVSGASQVMSGHSLNATNFDSLMTDSSLTKLVAGGAVALALFVGRYRVRNAFALPGVLLMSIAAVHLVLLLSGISLTEAQSAGWLFEPQTSRALAPLWTAEEVRSFPWGLLPSLSGDLLAVMFVTTISLLLNITGIELAAQREADLDRELNALGIANAASAALGGYVSCVSLSRSILNHAAGASGRLSGIIVAGVSAVMMLTSPGFLAYIPKCALGGLLLYIGFELMYRWLISSSRQLLFVEYISLATIAFIIINWGFISGVLIGLVIGCTTFAVNASRVNAIKFSFDGTNYRSSLDRDAADFAVLNELGRKIQGMSLQSYLFFGSAYQLYQHIKGLLINQADCRFLVFDFRLVTGIDSSATHSFRQIKRAADERGVKLVLVNLAAELDRAFRTTQFLSHDMIVASDLDHALETCENTIIAEFRSKSAEGETFEEWLTDALGSAQSAAVLAQHCNRIEVRTGGIIARQDQAADSMHFILKGRVGIIVKLEDGRSVRVRSLGPRTTIGEMGLFSRRARSATIEAEVATILYELRIEAYERIKRENSGVSHALLNYVVAVMSERLNFANRVIGILQR